MQTFPYTPDFDHKDFKDEVNSRNLYAMLESAHRRGRAKVSGAKVRQVVRAVDSGPVRQDTVWVVPKQTRASRLPPLRNTTSVRSVGHNQLTGREFWSESTIERDFADILKTDHTVCDIEEQPEPVRFLDDSGNQHEHVFDFRVTHSDGTRVAYACKPASKRQSSGIDRILQLIGDQVTGFADRFEVRTREHFSRDEVYNARFKLHARRLKDLHDIARLQAYLANIRGWMPFEAAVATPGDQARTLIAVVNLIDDGDLVWGGAPRLSTSILICPTPYC